MQVNSFSEVNPLLNLLSVGLPCDEIIDTPMNEAQEAPKAIAKDGALSPLDLSAIPDEEYLAAGLVYKEEVFSIIESDVPPGELDLDALPLCKFKQSNLTEVYKKKHIVVSHLGLSRLSQCDGYLIEIILGSVRRAGFPLLFYTGKELVKISSDHLLYENCSRLAHVSENELFATCSKANIGKTQTYWLNWSNIARFVAHFKFISRNIPNFLEDILETNFNSIAHNEITVSRALLMMEDPLFLKTVSKSQNLKIIISENDTALSILELFEKTPKIHRLTIKFNMENLGFLKNTVLSIPEDKIEGLIVMDDCGMLCIDKSQMTAFKIFFLNSVLAFEFDDLINNWNTNWPAPTTVLFGLNDHYIPEHACGFKDKKIELETLGDAFVLKPNIQELRLFFDIDRGLFDIKFNSSLKKLEIVVIGENDYSDDYVEQCVARLYSCIKPHASTLTKLSFRQDGNMQFPESRIFEMLFKGLLQLNMPNINSLYFREIDFVSSDLIEFLSHFPSLKRVSIVNSHIYTLSKLQKPLGIEILDLYSVNDDDGEFFEDFLICCPNLIYLYATDFKLTKHFATFENLRALKVKEYDTEAISLSFPNARHNFLYTPNVIETPGTKKFIAIDSGKEDFTYNVRSIFGREFVSRHRDVIEIVEWENGEPSFSFPDLVYQNYCIPVEQFSDALIGTDTIVMTSEWQKLTTLSCNDRLLKFECDEIQNKELEFSKDQFGDYYVRFKTINFPKKVQVKYSITKPILYNPIAPSEYFELKIRFDEKGPTTKLIPLLKTSYLINPDIDQHHGNSIDWFLAGHESLLNDTPPILHSDYIKPIAVFPENYVPTQVELLDKLIHFFRSFEVGDAEVDENAPYHEQINTILDKKTGIACEGRSELFCLIVKELIPGIECYLVSNECHAFVQVILNGFMRDIDLGGYPSKIEIDQPPVIEKREIEEKPLQTISKGVDETIESTRSLQDYTDTLVQDLLRKNGQVRQALLVADQKMASPLHLAVIESANRCKLAVGYMDIRKRKLWGVETTEHGFERRDALNAKILKEGGILFVNLETLSAGSIASLLQLTDPEGRQISGIQVHPETVIIAFLPQDYTVSSDIGRRFSIISQVSNFEYSPSVYGSVAVVDSNVYPMEDYRKIDLYQGISGWQNELLGTINEKMEWVPGCLIQAISEHKSVVIANPPQDPEFDACIRQLNYRKILSSGKEYEIDADFRVYLVHEAPIQTTMQSANPKSQPDFVLNKSTLPQFISLVNAEGRFIAKTKGLLHSSEKNEMTILVTENLNQWEWKKFLDSNRSILHRLYFQIPRGFQLPGFIKLKGDYFPLNFSNVIETENTTETVKTLLKENQGAMSVNIAAHHRSSDLLPILVNNEKSKFDFSVDKGPVWKALKKGEHVILNGKISPTLLQELTPLLINSNGGIPVNGVLRKMRGKLTVVKEPGANVEYCQFQRHINDDNNALQALFSTREIALARALAKQGRLNETSSTLKRLIEFKRKGVKEVLHTFQLKDVPPVLFNNRMSHVQQIWDVSPIVYIWGPPASGKSHFIFEVLPKNIQGTCYYSLKSVEAFLSHKGFSVLCLDEGDMKSDTLESLKALNENPKTFFYNRKIFTLEGEKKVVITGNGTYCQRSPLEFIATHGGAVHFGPLPLDQIKNLVMQNDLPEEFKSRLIRLYQSAGCIELRDLQTICAYFEFYNTVSLGSIDIAEICFSERYKEDRRFDAFKMALLDDVIDKSRWNRQYWLTSSRKEILWRIYTALWLRGNGSKSLQKGLLIQGPAGEGKTELVRKALEAFKVEDYLMINMTDDPDDVRDRLYEAFHSGKIVVIDEIDGLFEEELNAYLTGRDLSGKRASNPGFFIFATANGVDYAFRLPRKESLNSRFIQETMAPYSQLELEEILTRLGVEEAGNWVEVHMKAVSESVHEVLKPTPADLFAKAKLKAVARSKRVKDDSEDNRKRPAIADEIFVT